MRFSLSIIFLLSFSWSLYAQATGFSSFIEINPEEHTRIVTCRPAQLFVENAENFVIDLSGSTGYNKSMPHIAPSRALAQIKGGEVLSPQLKVFATPRDNLPCQPTVYPVQALYDDIFLQTRSFCNEVKFSMFFMNHATNRPYAIAPKNIELKDLNIIHEKLMIHKQEAYAILVRTPELKPNGSFNLDGVASDTAMLVKLNFDRGTYDTISFFRVPTGDFESLYEIFGEVRLNSDLSRLDLVLNDTILMYTLGIFEPKIRVVANFLYNAPRDFDYAYINEFSIDSSYYQGTTSVRYHYNEGDPYLDSTYIKFPPHQFKYRDGLSIYKLNNSQLLFAHAPGRNGEDFGARILGTDYEGNIKWVRPLMPEFYDLFISNVVELEDTLILAGGYFPGRFIKTGDFNKPKFVNYGYSKVVVFRLLADGTSLVVNPDVPISALEVFPNPFQVDINFSLAGAAKYQLLLLNGAIVVEEELNPELGVYRVSHPWLSSGLYVLRVYDINGQISESKLFKTK